MSEPRWHVAWGLASIPFGAASLLVPLYVIHLGGTPVDLGALGAVAALVGAPGAILAGRLVDRSVPARTILLACLVGVAGTLTALPALSRIGPVILANAVIWLAFAAATPVLTVVVVEDVPEPAWPREIAALNRVQGFGWTAGLLLGLGWSLGVGGKLEALFAQRLLLIVCGVVIGIAAIALRHWMPVVRGSGVGTIQRRRLLRLSVTRRTGVRGMTGLLSPARLLWATRPLRPRLLLGRLTPTLAAYFIAVLLFFVGFTAFFAPLPLYLTDLGFAAEMVYAFYLIASLASAVFYTTAGSLSARIDLQQLQASALGARGLAIPLVGVVGGALAGSAVAAVTLGVLFVVIGITWAVIAVTAGAIVTRLAPHHIRGEALGVYAALSTFAGVIGSFGGGAVAASYGFGVAFGFAGVAVIAGAVLVVVLPETPGPESTPRSGEPGEPSV